MTATSSREAAVRRLKAKRDFKSLAGVAGLVTIITVVVWAATGADYFWPMWPVLGLGIALLAAAWQAYGPGEERPITEDEIEQEMRRG